jgi:hypothetical protein
MMCREAACVPFCPRGFSSWSVLLRQSPHPPPALCLLEKLNPLPPAFAFHHCIPFGFQFELTRHLECAANNALSGVREDRAYLPDLAATVSTLLTSRPP